MRHTIALLLLMLSPLAATAQEFGMNWIRSATAQEGHGVLFRKMVTGTKEADHAWLEVASQGYVDVYVNERNIDRHAPVVSQKAPITVRRFDITPFLREDTNVVAVEYFPRDTMPADRQLAINIYGLYTDGSPLTLQTDATWLCRASQRQWMDGDEELQDATINTEGWNATQYAPALWTGADEVEPKETKPMEAFDDYSLPYRPCLVTEQRFFDNAGSCTHYDFGPALVGFLRVTLRGPRRGDILHFGPLTYVCSGELDEQAFTKFVPRTIRRVKAWGEGGYDREWIQFFQAIGVARDLPGILGNG